MTWWDEQTWANMVAGENCGMCQNVALESNPFSDLVAVLDHSYVRLARNQTHAGYCLVILKEHATELHALDTATLAGFWAGVARAGRAIDDTLHPTKIDYFVMGHRMPHVHCHLYPQHLTDDPFRNPDISDGDTALTLEATRSRVTQLQLALQAQHR